MKVYAIDIVEKEPYPIINLSQLHSVLQKHFGSTL